MSFLRNPHLHLEFGLALSMPYDSESAIELLSGQQALMIGLMQTFTLLNSEAHHAQRLGPIDSKSIC